MGLKARMTASPSTHNAVKVAAVRSRTAVLISSVPLHIDIFVLYCGYLAAPGLA